MPKISIICPVYKAEQYLHQCINSVLQQTFEDFELLLVDDGSPDRSGVICDKYAQQDSRIRVFHKANGGVASARQLGLDNAIGEYTIHIDPDDWVDLTMLEELYCFAKKENADIVICDFYINYTRLELYKVSGCHRDTTDQYLKDIICKYHGSLCNKLIKRSCYYSPNVITFIPNQDIFEDLIVCVKILISSRRVSYYNKAYYHYNQTNNPNSLTHTRQMYEKRRRLNDILFELLPLPEYEYIHGYLKKIEAYHALRENIFGKKGFISRYKAYVGISTGLTYDRNVNSALAGHYYIEYLYIYIKDFIKMCIRKLL